MKLRRLAEDFRVDEVSSFPVDTGGPFACYRLQKRGIGTPEAIDQLLRKWDLQRKRISYGGLKDRHAITTQFLTIHNGPAKSLKLQHFALEYLGRAARAFTATDIEGNRFELTLRSMSPEEVQRALQTVPELSATGVPNYFDDQRFGSVTTNGEFIAAPWVKGDYERTLWLAFAAPTPFDRPAEREQKEILRTHWGDWKTCKAQLERSHRRSIITFLDDRPGDFRGAWGRTRPDMRSLYLAAFQSYLWNEILAEAIRQRTSESNRVLVPMKLGGYPFFRGLESGIWNELQSLSIPLPTARQKLEPGPVTDLVRSVLQRLGWEQRELRVKYPRDSFFSKHWRNAVVSLRDFAAESGIDELDSRRQKLTLSFTLPRGSYATIVVKRLTTAAGVSEVEGLEEDSDAEEGQED